MRMLLAIGSLTLVWSFCGPLRAQPKDAPPAPPAWQNPIDGLGKDEEAAKKDAVRRAKEELDRLRQARTSFVNASDLTEDDIKNRFLTDAGTAGKDQPVDGLQEPFKRWIVTLKPETERLLRADERQTISYLAMIGLSILLVAGVGYIRLDDYTHRRYTTWLRLAGVGVVSSAVAGWWVMAR